MLKTRLWMGSLLSVLVIGVLLFDPGPWYPFLLLLTVFLAAAGSVELHQLIGSAHGLSPWLGGGAVLLVLLANWPAHLWPGWFGSDPWFLVLAAFAAMVLLGFLVEMALFRPAAQIAESSATSSGSIVIRLALLVWMTAYLGLLPSFLVQLRWLDATATTPRDARGALALAIFVAKCCDIGAYFTGRLLGRHPMSPVLSPKKTWEGLMGGLLLSAAAAVAINRPLSVVRGGDLWAVAFGLVVGGVGALGDLAESLIKRDCRRKDASQVVPGFGGVLDVVDSILFAAPVAYCWLRW
ncbi:MAG TPA: phosphatidate cytidylyltransferase [Gemmataceae bacterium]|nr:phosphatidate cytidylyltransferase [Gemmataceae bacterium]